MGVGDFKLSVALGAWLGAGTLPVLAFMSALVGLADALIIRVARDQLFAFGPSPAIAGWVVFTVNEPINQFIRWWLTKSGF